MANLIEDMAYESGGEDPTKLTPQNMKDWNVYVDWLEKKGMKGSKDLDKGETSFQWLDNFVKENPTTSIKREHIPLIQQEVQKLADNARAFAARRGDPNAEKIMTGTSRFDGIPGSKTTSFKFPEMTEQQFQNNSLVKQANLGLVSGELKPTGAGVVQKSKLPPGKTPFKGSDGNMYFENEQGDYELYKQ